MKRKTLVVGMELWEWACWGCGYGIMGMDLLGLWVWNYRNGPAGVLSMKLWEWACWSIEYEIMEWNYHKWLVTG